ncbi:RAS p21 protein activator 2 [Cricetulus griseus]
MRDCFCTINLDQEEVYRTQVVEKSLRPYFSEEFYFEIPRTFQYLSFYVYDKNVLQRDLRIGKVAIKKEDLCNHSGKETWFSLQPIDSNSEVQGKVHLELKLNELITENGTVCQQLVVHIKACHGLPLINGQNCDPYATVSLVGPSRNDQKKTKVKKKTSNPQFNEIFYFEVTRSSSYTRKSQFQVEEEDIEKLEIRIDLWNNENLVQDVFLGEIKVPVNVLRNDSSHQAWYLLQPRDNGNKSSKTDDLGSLRLTLCYTEDYVLPSEYYDPLKTLLLKSPDVQPVSASAAYILGEICQDQKDAVLPLVRLLLHHNKLVPFITAVAELDLKDTQDASTIFRGNTLATRCLDEMMKIVGGHYLKVTLKPILDEICESSKSCEIDPVKLKEGDNVENNKENLHYYVDKVFNTIVGSSVSCPTVMCDIFYSLRQMAAKRFPNNPHVQYSAVTSFVFLRFFAVAILSPHTFHLRPHYPDTQTNRTLTLISKTIQTLGNWGSLSRRKSRSKKSVMCEFLKMFQEERYFTDVKKFLDEISSTETKESSGTSEPVHLKEGEMYKRAQGRTRIGKKNFKKRWFCLTSRELTYHKQPGKDPIYTIPVKNILAVEKLEESSFNKKNQPALEADAGMNPSAFVEAQQLAPVSSLPKAKASGAPGTQSPSSSSSIKFSSHLPFLKPQKKFLKTYQKHCLLSRTSLCPAIQRDLKNSIDRDQILRKMNECLFMMATYNFLTLQFMLVRAGDSTTNHLPVSLEPLLMTIRDESYTQGKEICIWGLQLTNPEIARLVSVVLSFFKP